MSNSRHTLIAREGWLLVLVVSAVAVVVAAYFNALAASPVVVLLLILLFLFRDPPRKIPSAPLGLVSPVDGRITAIETVHDDYLDRQAIRLTIRMHWYGTYTTRSPMEGKIMDQWYGQKDGKPMPANSYVQWVQSDEGDDIVVCMQTDKVTRRPGCLVHSGERIGQGQRCGFIHFGETVKILVPVSTRIDKAVGDKVLAGSDIIATLVHKEQEKTA